jgi:hypothetical protein bfra3_16308
MTNIKERVLYFIENQGEKKETFFEDLGMSYANFKGVQKKSALGSDKIDKILSKYPDLNLEWLFSGKGEMLKSETTKTETSKEESVKGIPLVNATAIGGYGNNVFSFEERDVKDYYVIPKFKHKQVDFMIEVEGSSMYPKYNSGDVVACRIIKERNFIQWNKTHVIATREQGIIIKRIKPSDAPNSLLMVSDNESYDPFNVPEEEIEGLAIVVGVIRLE